VVFTYTNGLLYQAHWSVVLMVLLCKNNGMREKTGNPILAAKVKAERERLHLSQEKLAELAGLSLTYVQKLENADRYGSTKTHQKLAQIFGIPVAQLLEEPETESEGDDEDAQEWIEQYVSDTGARVYFKREYLRKLSPKTWRQIAAIIREETNEDE